MTNWLPTALRMREKGATYREIGDRLGYWASHIQRTLKRHDFAERRAAQIGGSKTKLVVEAYFMRPDDNTVKLAKHLGMEEEHVCRILEQRGLPMRRARNIVDNRC